MKIYISLVFIDKPVYQKSYYDIRFYINALCKSSHFSFNKQLLKEIILIREYIKIIVINSLLKTDIKER